MSEKQKQPQVYNVIYNISQGDFFSSGETSEYGFITNLLRSLLWKNFKKKASIRWQDSARRQFQAGLRGDVGL